MITEPDSYTKLLRFYTYMAKVKRDGSVDVFGVDAGSVHGKRGYWYCQTSTGAVTDDGEKLFHRTRKEAVKFLVESQFDRITHSLALNKRGTR